MYFTYFLLLLHFLCHCISLTCLDSHSDLTHIYGISASVMYPFQFCVSTAAGLIYLQHRAGHTTSQLRSHHLLLVDPKQYPKSKIFMIWTQAILSNIICKTNSLHCLMVSTPELQLKQLAFSFMQTLGFPFFPILSICLCYLFICLELQWPMGQTLAIQVLNSPHFKCPTAICGQYLPCYMGGGIEHLHHCLKFNSTGLKCPAHIALHLILYDLYCLPPIIPLRLTPSFLQQHFICVSVMASLSILGQSDLKICYVLDCLFPFFHSFVSF